MPHAVTTQQGGVTLFLLSYAIKHIYRRYIKCLTAACICMSFVILLCGLGSSIRKQEAELDAIYNTMPIYVELSDIKGNRNNLCIYGAHIDIFTSEEYELSVYLKDICFKRTLKIQEFEDNKQLARNEELEFYLIGITNVESMENLWTEQGENIKLQDGFSYNMFLETSDYCLVNERLLQLLGKELGDSILLTVKSLQNDFSREEPKEVKAELLISGVVKSRDFNTIYCSWNKASLLGAESDYSGIWYTESMRAAIRDNHLLNEFKEKAKTYFSHVDITAPKAMHLYALTVYDSIFTKTVFQIQRNIQFLKAILPMILLISFGLSFLTSFLLTRSRKQELAIMRSLGISKSKVMAIVLIENCTIGIMGILFGGLTVRFLLKFNVYIADIILFFICFTAGTVLFAFNVAAWNTLRILRIRE
jgi:hypothetical protein